MDPRDTLLNVPRLSESNAALHAHRCKVCGGFAPFFDVVDFNKCHSYIFGPSGVYVPFYRCDDCGFLFTNFFDAWSTNDFSRFIYNEDLPLVDVGYDGSRSQQMAETAENILSGFRSLRLLDYGAGRGLFAQHMNAKGFNVESYDPISIQTRPKGTFDIITSFEVIEHSPTPIETIADINSFLTDDGCILFSQTLQPPEIEQIRCNWWYAAPRNGHVSLYSDHSIALLAERHGMTFYNGGGFHALASENSRLKDLAETIGRPVHRPIILGAPLDDTAYGWNGLEGPAHRQYRWTATKELTWNITLPANGSVTTQVKIPYILEIRAEFAAECRVMIGGKPARRVPDLSTIVVEADGSIAGETDVLLITPPHLRPVDVNGQKDDRLLGLAVRARC